MVTGGQATLGGGDSAQAVTTGGQATSGSVTNDASFNESLVFGQSNPRSDTPETAGVQTVAAATPDRTAIIVQIAPQLQQMIRTIVAILPSTGGPSLIVLASTLLALGGLGV